MKISIITVVKNNERTIRQAVESVLAQKDVDLEYIVIDGESTDNTFNILKEYQDRIAVLVSEKDRNMYHALNKAIGRATGDVIGILHSDDIYASDTVLSEVMQCFESEKTTIVYGDLAIVKHDNDKNTVRYWQSSPFKRYKLYLGWMPPHPTMFVRRELYGKYGVFDTEIKIAADYDIILRLLLKEGENSHYLHRLIVKMRAGGASNNTPVNTIRKIKDDYRIVKRHNIGGLFTVLIKKMRKMHQYIVFKKIK